MTKNQAPKLKDWDLGIGIFLEIRAIRN